jgi:hypothetical protein
MTAPLDKEQEKRLGTRAPVFNDQRFQDMLDGTRGVRQADVPKATEKTTYTNLDTTGKPIEGYQAVKTVVPVESFPQASQALRPKTAPQTNIDILAKRLPGQAIRYHRNGLNVEFAPGTPNQEIMAFTESHRRETSPERMAQARAETAARAAFLKEQEYNRIQEAALPPMPIMPALKTNDSMADYNSAVNARAKIIADTNIATTAQQVQREANRLTDTNNQAQNAITKDRYAVQSEVDRGKLGVDQETAKAQQGLWSSQADKHNSENRLATEVYDPAVTPERLAQIEQASRALAGGKAQGTPFRQYVPGTPAIGGQGGTTEGIVVQGPDETYTKQPITSVDPYDYRMGPDGKMQRRLKQGAN